MAITTGFTRSSRPITPLSLPPQTERSLARVVSGTFSASSSALNRAPLTDVEILSIESIPEFESLLKSEETTEEELLAAYDNLPSMLRSKIEDRVYLHEVKRRGAGQLKEPDYDKHAIEDYTAVPYPIALKDKFTDPSEELSQLLDLLNQGTKDATSICNLFARLDEGVKQEVYKCVYEEAVIQSGKPLCPDRDGVSFGKFYTRQNPLLLKNFEPDFTTSLWKAALQDSAIVIAGRVNALQYQIPGKGVSSRIYIACPYTVDNSLSKKEDSFTRICSLLSSGADLTDEVLAQQAIFAVKYRRFHDLVKALGQFEDRPNRYSIEYIFDVAVTSSAEKGHYDFVEILLDEGPLLSEKGLKDAVTRSVENGHLEIARLILDDFLVSQGRSVNQSDIDALIQNISEGNTGSLRLLLQQQAIHLKEADSPTTQSEGKNASEITDISSLGAPLSVAAEEEPLAQHPVSGAASSSLASV